MTTAFRPFQLEIDELRADGDTQPRAEIDDHLVWEYKEAYEAGAKFPPLDVFFDGTDYWLADGFHRWHAARQTEMTRIACKIHEGTMQDARWYSYSANQTHGLRRSNADKRKAVLATLRHPKGAKMSDRQIAEHVGVSAPTIGKYRDELAATVKDLQSDERTGRDGRTIDTSNIGGKGKQVEPDRAPKTDDEPRKMYHLANELDRIEQWNRDRINECPTAYREPLSKLFAQLAKETL